MGDEASVGIHSRLLELHDGELCGRDVVPNVGLLVSGRVQRVAHQTVTRPTYAGAERPTRGPSHKRVYDKSLVTGGNAGVPPACRRDACAPRLPLTKDLSYTPHKPSRPPSRCVRAHSPAWTSTAREFLRQRFGLSPCSSVDPFGLSDHNQRVLSAAGIDNAPCLADSGAA